MWLPAEISVHWLRTEPSVDRRAGRLATPEAMRLAKMLNTIEVEGAQIFVESVKEHRFALGITRRGVGMQT